MIGLMLLKGKALFPRADAKVLAELLCTFAKKRWVRDGDQLDAKVLLRSLDDYVWTNTRRFAGGDSQTLHRNSCSLLFSDIDKRVATDFSLPEI